MIKIAPYIKITSEEGKTLQDRITKFDYLYSEEEDDVCELTVESDNPKLADDPAFQEGKSLTVTWGYLDYTPLQSTRKIYIFDTRTEYSEDGITLTLVCHEKFAISKMDTARNKTANGSTDKNVTKVLFSTDVWENFNVDQLSDLVYRRLSASSQGKDSKYDPRLNKNSSSTEASFAKADNSLNPLNSDNNLQYVNPDDPLSPKLSYNPAEGMLVTLYNGSNSTYRTLKTWFDKQSGGPYVIDSRDDKVTIRLRNLFDDPVRSYVYKGEDGELLSFTPESKNRSKSKTSNQIDTVNWDSSSKSAILQTSSKEKEAINDSPTMKIWNASPVPVNPFWFQQNQEENNKARVIGPNSKKVGSKDWKKPEPKDSGKASKYETDRGWLIYTDDFVRSVQKTPFGLKEEKTTTAPEYVKKQKTKPKDGPSKTIVRASESSRSSKSFAENRRKNDDLETNPATAKMIGNPLLECGKVINVSNVASKHAGKYYIKECRHTIDNEGYMTSIEKMVRGEGKSNSKGKTNKSKKPGSDKKKAAVASGQVQYDIGNKGYEVMDFSDIGYNPTARSKEEQYRVGMYKNLPVVKPEESKKK